VIAVVDYGVGNVQAFLNIYERLNIDAIAARDVCTLQKASKIILPGVGAFDWAMSRLTASGLRTSVEDLVINQLIPVLGVCVGMQMLADSSEEGTLPGLGWISGQVKRFADTRFNHATHLPHMGWNDVEPVSGDGLFSGLERPRFYFLHSYFFEQADTSCVLAETDYGGMFSSAVRRGHIMGTQFHPEKSHRWGVQLLKNFAEI